mmetsp:Transcript_6309/g.16039  ORF Transcript_6309/g.16039 Transcript_6309/m.16039 type:complete len:148 (+) Transcript_6309:1512-1955(+)
MRCFVQNILHVNPEAVILWESSDGYLKHIPSFNEWLEQMNFSKPRTYNASPFVMKTSDCQYGKNSFGQLMQHHHNFFYKNMEPGWKMREQCRPGSNCTGHDGTLRGSAPGIGNLCRSCISFPEAMASDLGEALFRAARPSLEKHLRG